MVNPNFFIVGAAKSGTTSLYHYIKQHPDIYMPKRKERFFFSGINKNTYSGVGSFYGDYIIDNWEEYIQIFKESTTEVRIGEACVAYLYFYRESITNMKKYLDCIPKIIIILRNPIDRAYSNYLHHVRDGIEKLSFEDSIQDNIIKTRLKEKWWWGFDYLNIGLYYKQVKFYFDSFGKENTLIILYDEFKQKPQITCKKTFEFLDVDNSYSPDISHKYNVSGIPKNKILLNTYHLLYNDKIKKILRPILFNTLGIERVETLLSTFWQKNYEKFEIEPNLREKINIFFNDDINKLEDLISKDLSSWIYQ